MKQVRERRLFSRSRCKADVITEGGLIKVRDWSLGGACLNCVDREAFLALYTPVRIRLFILNFQLSFSILAEIAWWDPCTSKLAISFPTREAWNIDSDVHEIKQTLIEHLGLDAVANGGRDGVFTRAAK